MAPSHPATGLVKKRNAQPYSSLNRAAAALCGNESGGAKARLGAIYRSWCRRVGFDNARKYVHLRDDLSGDLPGFDPEDFFSAWLQFGVSGTCWPAAEALCALLEKSDLSARRLLGRIEHGDGPADHGAIVVELDGTAYLLDPAILSNEILPLQNGKASQLTVGGVSCAFDGCNTVTWTPPHTGTTCRMRILAIGCSQDEFHSHYQRSGIRSLFNAAPFFRRNQEQGTVTITQSFLIRTLGDGDPLYEELTSPQTEMCAVAALCGVDEVFLSCVYAASEIQKRRGVAWKIS